MRAIDTNVLVRLVVRDDPAQVEAAEQFVSRGAWVLDSVYELDGPRMALAVEMLLNHTQLAIQDADVVAAALESFRKRPAVNFSDHLIVAIARKSGHLPAGTFDRDLARVEGVERV